jgi:hypothetical protein
MRGDLHPGQEDGSMNRRHELHGPAGMFDGPVGRCQVGTRTAGLGRGSNIKGSSDDHHSRSRRRIAINTIRRGVMNALLRAGAWVLLSHGAAVTSMK